MNTRIALGAAFTLLCTRGLALDIRTKEDFLAFSRKVTNGNPYKGKTVLLQDDIDLSGVDFEPMGIYLDNFDYSYFEGTFNGQGHTISNLNITSTHCSVGLFGYVFGGLVENVVLDSSCTIHSNYGLSAGGLIGEISSKKSSVTVQNIVNMADVLGFGFNSLSSNYSIGGITGYLCLHEREIKLFNCINLGKVSHSNSENGTDHPITHIGGIAGDMKGNKKFVRITNCLNVGDIRYSTVLSTLTVRIGGISGNSYQGVVTNCVNMGDLVIDAEKSNSSYVYTGKIIGYGIDTEALNCYSREKTYNHTSVDANHSLDGIPFGSDLTLYDEVEIGKYKGTSLIHALNAFTELFYFYDLSKWLLNKNENTVSILSSESTKKPIILKSTLILLPQLSDNEKTHFYGWYNDGSFKTPFTAQEVNKDAILYGKYDKCNEKYTINFDFDGKLSTTSIIASFGEVVPLPQLSQNGEVIGVWELRAEEGISETVEWNFIMPAYDVILYAVWMKTVISSAADLKKLSDDVNSGATYSGYTVIMENDIDMSGVDMSQIGNGISSFRGTFDGRGHVIRNMLLNSTDSNNRYAGLFGYSEAGIVVRNLILDDSCAIRHSNEELNSELYTGGFIGYCYAKETKCVLENSVNMGVVEFHNTSNGVYSELYVGGLVGAFKAFKLSIEIVNSAFIGTVQSDAASNPGFIGGIAGKSEGIQDIKQSKIENCVNAGNVFAGEGTYYVGGFSGSLEWNIAVQNCVNLGSFKVNLNNIIGGQVTGWLYDASVENCYWREILILPMCGEAADSNTQYNSAFNKNFNLVDSVSVGGYTGYSLISALNAYTKDRSDLSRWAINNNEENVTFVVNDKTAFSMSIRLILMPSFASANKTHFVGWYEGADTSKLFTEGSITNATRFYGIWEEERLEYTVVLDDDTYGEVRTVNVGKGENLINYLSEPRRKEREFIGWVDEYGRAVDDGYKMPTRNLTLTALWMRTKLYTPHDLKEFSEEVNRGMDCSGRVIQMLDDIDMDGITGFESIGTGEHPFKGIFEGHGNRIRNLNISSSAQYSGFIGNAIDATVRNLILDESCSIESTYSTGYGSVGSVVGYCSANQGNCSAVNIVNYASVSFHEDSQADTMNIGGIVGIFKGFGPNCLVMNCANYGPVTQKGKTRSTWIGGIAGRCKGQFEGSTCNLWNNVNYGRVSHVGKTNNTKNSFGAGGIIGSCDDNTNVNGCVSGGDIYMKSIRVTTIGSITGASKDTCTITENLWFRRLSYSDISNNNPEIEDDMTTENGESVIDVLRSYSRSTKVPQGEWDTENYTATWVVNPTNANVTAMVNGKNIASYNTSIVLLPTFMDNPYTEHHFYGWLNGETKKKVDTCEVVGDTTFTGNWEQRKSIVSKILIITVTISGVVLFALLAVLYAYCSGYKKRKDDKDELRELLYPKAYEEEEPADSLNRVYGLYPDYYTISGELSMKDALLTAGLLEEQANVVVARCYENAQRLEDSGKLPENVTVDDAAALAMYTFDFGADDLYHLNPYRIINSALNKKTKKGLEGAKGILYLLMRALRKLPVVFGRDLHRSIRAEVSVDGDEGAPSDLSSTNQRVSNETQLTGYKEGSVITWNALSSTSPDMGVTQAFLAKGSKSGNAAGTLFIISGGWGYDIQPYSLFPGEAEILIEPERQLRVASVLKAELTIVRLVMLKTPLVLPDVFGRHDLRVPSLYFVKERAYSTTQKKNRGVLRLPQRDERDESRSFRKRLSLFSNTRERSTRSGNNIHKPILGDTFMDDDDDDDGPDEEDEHVEMNEVQTIISM